MAISRYPVQAQALYSELLSRLRAAELEGLFDREGSLASKTQEGRKYWYIRRRIRGRIKETYLGPETPELLDRLEQVRSETEQAVAAAKGRRELVRLLQASGYPYPDRRTGRVLSYLADAGVFRLRGVLVGTHAFRCYSAMLGARLPETAALTTDIDLAQFRTVSVAVGDTVDPEFAKALEQAERFVPILPIDRKSRSSSWQAEDRALRVELLTPMVGPPDETSVELPALKAHAKPLRFLDYLIYGEEPAAIPFASGIIVRVPRPERYALHKLIVAARREDRDKSRKDIEQAQSLLDVLLEDRRDDVLEAWTELLDNGAKWKRAADRGLRALAEPARGYLSDLAASHAAAARK